MACVTWCVHLGQWGYHGDHGHNLTDADISIDDADDNLAEMIRDTENAEHENLFDDWAPLPPMSSPQQEPPWLHRHQPAHAEHHANAEILLDLNMDDGDTDGVDSDEEFANYASGMEVEFQWPTHPTYFRSPHPGLCVAAADWVQYHSP